MSFYSVSKGFTLADSPNALYSIAHIPALLSNWEAFNTTDEELNCRHSSSREKTPKRIALNSLNTSSSAKVPAKASPRKIGHIATLNEDILTLATDKFDQVVRKQKAPHQDPKNFAKAASKAPNNQRVDFDEKTAKKGKEPSLKPWKNAKSQPPADPVKEAFRSVKEKVKKDASKLIDPKHNKNYLPLFFPNDPKAMKPETQLTLATMNRFLESHSFDHFYDQFTDLLALLTKADLDSIITDHPTPVVQELLRLFNILNDHGFYNFYDRNINFWSGNKAKAKVQTLKDSISDAQIPAMRLAFCIFSQFKEKAEKKLTPEIKSLISLLGNVFSAFFVRNAKGVVEVYVSNNKKSELACLQVGNFFWNIELPGLQRLLRNGKVSMIMISFLQKKDPDVWSLPVDFNDPKNGKDILVLRRCPYMGKITKKLDDEHPERFEDNDLPLKGKKFEDWCQNSPPREVVSLLTLRIWKRCLGES